MRFWNALGRPKRPPWRAAFDQDLRDCFSSPEETAEARYSQVFRYLLTSFCDRMRPGGAAADQPGAPSQHGRDVDAMEAFSRLAPLLAAWVAGGRPAVIEDLRQRYIDVLALLREGLAAGTNPEGAAYWGDIGDRDQRIVEAADIARALWICRDVLLPLLTKVERERIAAWLNQVNSKSLPDNNWSLAVTLVDEVLHSLGFQAEMDQAARRFARFMTFYRGEGWFSDGPNPQAIDWYNVWASHYELFWLRELSSGYRTPALDEIVGTFAATMPYLLSPQGIPIMGRSVCYRLAAPAPLVAACLASPPGDAVVTPGLARHALDAVWRYFVSHGGFKDGCITQGYCGTDLRILDNYSGPSSALWGTRPLVLAFLAGPDTRFWTAPEELLPVEVSSFVRAIPSVGWEIVGDHPSADVRILLRDSPRDTPVVTDALEPFRLFQKTRGLLQGQPRRPANRRAKYELPVYSSKTPFCGCPDEAQNP